MNVGARRINGRVLIVYFEQCYPRFWQPVLCYVLQCIYVACWTAGAIESTSEIAAHIIKLELILAVLALGAAIYTHCFLCLRVVWNFKGEHTSTVFITEIKEQKMLTECLAKNTSGFCFRQLFDMGCT